MWNILRLKNQDIILWTKNLRGEKENMQYVHENRWHVLVLIKGI